MFNYTHEVIINSATRGGSDAFQASSGLLNILRAGSYKLEHVVCGKVYKTPGYEGTLSTVTLDLSDITAVFNENGSYRLTVVTKMPNKFLSDFAMANWYEFGRPVMVEFLYNSSMTNADLANSIVSALQLALPDNNKWLKVSADGTTVTIAAIDPYMVFSGVTVEYHEPTGCNSCVGYYEPRNVKSIVTIANGKEPFATAAWLVENLRFPSYPNVRYASPNEDERPTPGAVYTQYSFQYNVPRRGLGGLSVVGQTVSSEVTHTYYVRNDLVEAFDAAIKTAFGDDAILEAYTTSITSDTSVANDGVAVTLEASVTPANDSVTFTWAITDAEGNATTVTGVSLSGAELTVADTVDPGTTFYVTCTPSDSDYKSVTVEFTVIEA